MREFGHERLPTKWPLMADKRPPAGRCKGQTSVCSAISKASSTSMPKYLTVLSSLV
jgi:hypothetical protein